MKELISYAIPLIGNVCGIYAGTIGHIFECVALVIVSNFCYWLALQYWKEQS